MKKLLLLLAALSLPAFGQSSVYNATTYAYTTQVTQGNAATGSSSLRANPTAFAQGMPFLPYNLNAPITINRNAATAETVTPSAIANCYSNSLTCTLSGTYTFKHISGESIQSGTFGLQEAVNIAVAAGSGTVLIDASWQGPSGSSLITAATGNNNVLIQDNRNPSGATFYQWNGSAYVAQGGGGGSLPSAPGYGYVPVSTGPGTTYSAQTTLLGFGANGVQYIQQPLGSNFYPTVGINFLNKVFEVDGFSSYGGVGRAVSAYTGASDVPVCSVVSNSGLLYIAVASNNHGTTPGTNAAIWYLVPNNLPATNADCAAYMANSYTRSQNSGSIVQFGSGSYTMNQGFVYQETGSSFGDEFSVQFAGSGQGVTYLSYAGTAGVVWFSRPNGAANFSSLSIHDMTMDGGGLASSIMDLDTLNQSYFYHLSMGHIQPGSDHVAKFAHTGGFGFQVFLNEINVGVFPDTNIPNCAQITASGTTTISFTVTNGGTCYRTPTASLVAHTQLRGTQAGTAAFPCTVMPTGGGVPTFTGNALTSITPMTGATGCVGPYYVQVFESVPYAHGIVMNESDSSATDITSYVGDTSAFQINAGNFVGVHLHPSVVPNGIEWNASGQLVGTEIDDVFDKAFILNQPFSTTGVSITGTNGYVGCGGSSRINVGASMYYFAATTVNANIGDSASLFDFGGTNSTCNAGWTPFLTQAGPITSQATLLSKAPAGFSVTGQDKSLSQTTAIGDYIPALAVANLTVTTCTGCSSAGVTSLNTQTGSQTLVGDSSITVTPNGTNQVALHVNGTAGTGAVTSSPLQSIGGFQAAGTTIANAPNLYFVTPSNTQSQVNSLLAGLSGTNTVIIPDGTPQALYTTNGQHLWDARLNASYFQMPGVACDGKQAALTITITSGSNTSTVGSLLSAADVGKTFIFALKSGNGFGFTQSVWTATLSSYTFPTATWSANAPFSVTQQVYYGTDNLATINTAMTQASSTFPLTIPTGCKMLVSGTIPWNNAQVIVGRHLNQGGFIGVPGKDVIATTDTSGQSVSQPGTGLRGFAIVVGSEVDATFPVDFYSANATKTTQAAFYRPAQPHTPNANNPCAPGWMVGCTVGVGSITASSTSMTVPAGVTLPVNGSTIVFPYLTKVFTTTITGVNSGTRVVTLNAAAPTGSTQSQAEWFAGSSVQSTTTTIPGTPTYPFTLQLSNSIAPIPGWESNFAQWGHAKIQDYEFDYMGANPANNTIVVRRGPATVNGGSGYSGTNTITALNPCPANFETPWPVTPTINSGDSTPTGANWFPGLCVGNAAIAFPTANGNTFVGSGLVDGFLEDLQLIPSTVQSTNGVAGIYIAGNNAPFSSSFQDIKALNFQFGLVEGPASYGMHGVAAVGPTGIGNTFVNLHFFDAFPLSLVDLQSSTLDNLNFNSTMVNPYDGTAIGSATCLQEGLTLDEQTGGGVTNTQYLAHNAYACEPENGSNIVVPNAVISHSQHSSFNAANMEGIPNYFNGDHLKITNSQLSLPTINQGTDMDFGIISGTTAFYSTNVWNANPEFYNWGINSTCSTYVGSLGGPAVPCGPGFVQGSNGRSISNSVTNTKEENPEGGKITPGEWNTNGAFDSAPMSLSNVVDPTEPYWGRYGACNLGGAAQCHPEAFDANGGFVYIGTHQRIADQPYLAVFDLMSAAGAGQVTVTLSAFDSGTGQCASAGAIVNKVFVTTTSWPDLNHPFVLPVDFTGHAGCILQIQFASATTTDQYRVGYFNFIPASPSETVASSTTPTFSLASKVSNNTLTASVTSFTLPSGYDSQFKTICWKQGSGSYTVTAPTNVHGFFTVGTVNGGFNCQTYEYNATAAIWLATTPGVINE